LELWDQGCSPLRPFLLRSALGQLGVALGRPFLLMGDDFILKPTARPPTGAELDWGWELPVRATNQPEQASSVRPRPRCPG
jgi:hypothetical protein